MRLVLASNNAKKLAELSTLLAPLALDIVAQGALGVDEAEEPHHTFIENALAKARHAASHTGCAAIADDSGLCVAALGGAPGVASAHYAALGDTPGAATMHLAALGGTPDAATMHLAALGGAPAATMHLAALDGEPGAASTHSAAIAAAAGDDRESRRRAQDAANNARLLRALEGVRERQARYVSVLVALRTAGDPEPLVAVGRWEGEVLDAPRGNGGFGYDPLVFIPALGRSVAELDAATKNAHSHRALAAARMLALMREAWRLG